MTEHEYNAACAERERDDRRRRGATRAHHRHHGRQPRARAQPARGLGCGTGSPGTENVIDMPAWWRACQASGLCSTDSGGVQRHAAGRRGIGGVLCGRPAAIENRRNTGSVASRQAIASTVIAPDALFFALVCSSRQGICH